MSEPDELGERVTRLEGEVALARQDAAAARVLAGGADRDVAAMQSELRAHTRSLNALRQTQVEQGHEMREGFAEMREDFARVDAEMREDFARVDADMREGFARVDAEARRSFAVLSQGQARITELLTMHLGEGESESP
jgi:hypothetical protein